MRYLTGCGVALAIAALILSCSGAYWQSTMITPSSPTATVMLPPNPSSMYVRLPRSVVLMVTFEKSGPTGGVWASDCAVRQTIAANVLRPVIVDNAPTAASASVDNSTLYEVFIISPL